MTSKRAYLGFEAKHHPVLPWSRFVKRMGKSVALASGIAGASLLTGMCGYHFLEDLTWIDAFLNAAMILGGMGPVDQMKTDGGKLFAGCYALYSGLVLIASAGIILAPLMHRILHTFHAELNEKGGDD